MTPSAGLPFGLLLAVCLALILAGLGIALSQGAFLVGVLYVLIGGGCLVLFGSLGRDL